VCSAISTEISSSNPILRGAIEVKLDQVSHVYLIMVRSILNLFDAFTA
jgi:hypothetical protein